MRTNFTHTFKGLLVIFFHVGFLGAAIAQSYITNPKPSLKLTFLGESGTNGSAVAYNAKSKIYYAVIAGNVQYPLETFDKKGKPVRQQTANYDTRGMWWNPILNKLERNGYADLNIISNNIADNGYLDLTYNQTLSFENNIPDENSVGTFDFQADEVLYYDNGLVHRFAHSTGKYLSFVRLNLPTGLEAVNQYSIIYTGVTGAEIGLLNFVTRQVYFFNKNTGQMANSVVQLPADSVTDSRFWFSYANGYVWLYNARTRTWTGYKILKKPILK
jgi:hypothetical protein